MALWNWALERLSAMRWDAWEALGLVGEGLFFARLLVQWVASERERKPVLPVAYWYCSLAGAALLVFYALHKASFVILLPQLIGGVFYLRGWQLEIRHRRRERARREAGFDTPGFAWPALSLIVPVHNEAAALGGVLEKLVERAREYPGPLPRIVVALNGCVDDSEAAARATLADYPEESTRIVSDARAGMSFGKNLGAGAADGDLWLFVDADTILPENALRVLAEAAHGRRLPAGTVAGRPRRGGLVVRICFVLANRLTRRKKAHAPGGVMLVAPAIFAAAGGFDESLPQGTSTDFLRRALAAGGEYVFVDAIAATTSIRRFEKTGIIRQMWRWRRNHRDLDRDRRANVRARDYENVR